MLSLLEWIYSAKFGVGLLAGVGIQLVVLWLEARHADKVHPLPSGRRHRVFGIPNTWAATVLVLAVFGYVLLVVMRDTYETGDLRNRMEKCQAEFVDAIIAQRKIDREDRRLAKDGRELDRQLEDAQAALTSQIATRPADDSLLPMWVSNASYLFSSRFAEIRARRAQVEHDRDKLESDRRDHPLPELTCGHRAR